MSRPGGRLGLGERERARLGGAGVERRKNEVHMAMYATQTDARGRGKAVGASENIGAGKRLRKRHWDEWIERYVISTRASCSDGEWAENQGRNRGASTI